MNPVPGTTTIRVLIVEDEVPTALELEMRISALGCIVVGPAASGDRALALAAEQHPDLALVNINLPGGSDGVTTALHLRERFDIPSIFVTSDTNPELVTRGKPAQPFGWVVKPFSERELQVTLELAAHRNDAERRLRETKHELERALGALKQLTGLLPICSTCKKICDGQKEWRTVEDFISRHTNAQFSHGFCPDCYQDYLGRHRMSDTPWPPR